MTELVRPELYFAAIENRVDFLGTVETIALAARSAMGARLFCFKDTWFELPAKATEWVEWEMPAAQPEGLLPWPDSLSPHDPWDHWEVLT